MREIGDRPALVDGGDIEKVCHVRREPLYSQAGIEEQDAEIGRGHQILKVAVAARNRFQFELEFAVDRLQLLIDRLQLLLAGFELLRRRPILLVDRLQFLVGGAQLFVGGLRLLARRAQPILGRLQFLHQPAYRFDRLRLSGGGLGGDRIRIDGFALDEHHDCVDRRSLAFRDWLHLDVHAMGTPVERHQDRCTERGFALLEGAVQRRAQIEPELGADEVGDIAAERPARRLEKSAGAFRQMQNPIILSDQDARRRGHLQRLPMRECFARCRGWGYVRRKLRFCCA